MLHLDEMHQTDNPIVTAVESELKRWKWKRAEAHCFAEILERKQAEITAAQIRSGIVLADRYVTAKEKGLCISDLPYDPEIRAEVAFWPQTRGELLGYALHLHRMGGNTIANLLRVVVFLADHCIHNT